MSNVPPSSPEPAGQAQTETSHRELVSALERNLAVVRARIAAALTETTEGSQPLVPELVAVTKTVPPAVAMALAEVLSAQVDELPAAPGNLAENRADHFEATFEAFLKAGKSARWHFIGHIQRNKARRIMERANVLHSIDSSRLARAVARLADELEREIDVFVEVNLTRETEKHGLLPAEVPEVLDALAESSRVRILGLMAMGPARGLRTVDEVFGDVATLARQLESTHGGHFPGGTCLLSMGMSGDLEAAIRHGSSFVRIGSALFEGLPEPLPTTGSSTHGPLPSQGSHPR